MSRWNPQPFAARFWDAIEYDTNGGCWLWRSVHKATGYGNVYMDKARGYQKAHRASYELFCGPIPPGLIVMHKCDVPACVNPAHLSVGTSRDNALDAVRKGRMAPPTGKGGKNQNAKVSDAGRLIIAARRRAGERLASIAGDYGVSKSTVHYIARTAPVGGSAL